MQRAVRSSEKVFLCKLCDGHAEAVDDAREVVPPPAAAELGQDRGRAVERRGPRVRAAAARALALVPRVAAVALELHAVEVAVHALQRRVRGRAQHPPARAHVLERDAKARARRQERVLSENRRERAIRGNEPTLRPYCLRSSASYKGAEI